MNTYPGRYPWLVLVIGTALMIGLSIYVNAKLVERARDGQREAVCEIRRTQLAVYRESPPSTETGRTAVRAWRDAGRIWDCED